MKKFILKFIIFCIPIALLFVPPFIVFVMSGESTSLSKVVEIQKKDPKILYLSSFTSLADRAYKFLGTASHNPEIIVIGTSRTLTFKSDFFKEDTFYNAGYNADTTLNAADLSAYLNNLSSDSKLKVILFDVSNYLKSATSTSEKVTVNYNPFVSFVTIGWRDLYLDYIKKQFSIKDFIAARKTNSNIGLTAVMHSFGYRADGSLQRGLPEEIRSNQSNIAHEVSHYFSLIDVGKADSSLQYGTSLTREDLAGIEKFLVEAKAKNIYVIGYLSPYATELYQKMNTLQNDYGDTYRKAPVLLQQVFADYNFHFYDTRDLAALGSSDKELYNAEHSTEKATLRLLISLAQKESRLAEYLLDTTTLKQQILLEAF